MTAVSWLSGALPVVEAFPSLRASWIGGECGEQTDGGAGLRLGPGENFCAHPVFRRLFPSINYGRLSNCLTSRDSQHILCLISRGSFLLVGQHNFVSGKIPVNFDIY